MTKARSDGFVLLLLGSFGFAALSLLLFVTQGRDRSCVDFRISYTTARCLQQGSDPYRQDDLLRVYQQVNGAIGSDSYGDYVAGVETRYFYLPTIFVVTLPLSALPYAAAQLIWIVSTTLACILAAFLMWDLAAEYAPLLGGGLLCFYLVNSMSSILWGNAAGLAVSLCVIATWCFLRRRFVVAGIVCLALSLVLKPHDSGLIWLYFLLAGETSRRWAWQVLGLVAACTLPVVAWLTRVAPGWIGEMRTNYASLSMRGAINDPGPASVLDRGACMLTNLQSVFGLVWDRPLFYNLLSYSVCAVPLLFWIVATRKPQTRERSWLLLAAIAALSTLPIYHRLYDARLLMLSVPPCALLWARGGSRRWTALWVTVTGLVLTADLPWVAYLVVVSSLHPATTGWPGALQIAAKAVPVPLAMLLVGAFFLAAAFRRSADSTAAKDAVLPLAAPNTPVAT